MTALIYVLEQAHESIGRILRVAPTLNECLMLQPSLYDKARKTLVAVLLPGPGRLQLLVDGDEQPAVTIDLERGDYIFKIDADYYLSSSDVEGRIVRVHAHEPASPVGLPL